MSRLSSVLAGAAGMLLSFVATAHGDITFSGRNWTTQDAAHRDNPAIHTEYTAFDANTGKMRGVFGTSGQDCSMVTPLSIKVGDVVSYDYSFTHDQISLTGGGTSDWIGDTATAFIAGTENTNNKYVTHRLIYSGNNVDKLRHDGANQEVTGTHPTTGLHMQFTFDSPTSYVVDITDIASGTPVANWAATLNQINSVQATVDDIKAFRVGLWDSEQTVTLANFSVVPEPASLGLLTCASLLALRRRR